MIKIDFSHAMIDGPLETHWDALLRVVADFRIVSFEQLWLQEPHFCVVELARDLSIWFCQTESRRDFVYQSLESEEAELIRFRQAENGQWQIHSAFQNFTESRPISDDALRGAVEGFLRQLASELPEGARVRQLLRRDERNGKLLGFLALAPSASRSNG